MKTPPPRLDLSARETHFLDHLAPVWLALPEDLRGSVFVGNDDVARHARLLGLTDVVIGWPERGSRLGPILCAAFGDLRICSRTRRPIVLFEHGAGQSYSNRHRSYVGGTGREHVALFVVPNAQAAERSRRFYPRVRTAIVGCPKLDDLLGTPPPTGPPTVAISFHWRCEVVPETGTAFDDFADELESTRITLERHGVELIGHGHPRILEELRLPYKRAGIEVVDTFAEVVARAHVYAVDNSSTLFEFAALDRPVVVLNAKAYRRDVNHGLRFWDAADVGLNAEPGWLAGNLLTALKDPPEVARSRRAAVARTYPVTDGTSADRAASAIVNLLAPRCLVCGASHASCGPATDVVPVDQRIKEKTRMGTVKRYPNPDHPGAFIKLDDAAAKRLGLLGKEVAGRTYPPPAGDVTNEGGAMVTSTTARTATTTTTEVEPLTPPTGEPGGAIRPAGPTHRARKEASMGDAVDKIAASSAAKVDEDEVKDKKRAAPSTRRRRVVKDDPQA